MMLPTTARQTMHEAAHPAIIAELTAKLAELHPLRTAASVRSLRAAVNRTTHEWPATWGGADHSAKKLRGIIVSDAPSQPDNSTIGAHKSNAPSSFGSSAVRIRCIGETELSSSATLPGFPVPYSVQLAANRASFAASEPTRCEFVEHIPAVHNCGLKSVATVATFTRGERRACEHHARASHRFGLAVAYDVARVTE